MGRLLLSCFLAGALGGATAWAHHTMPGRTHPSVTIGQEVLADGKPLPAGTYELWITDERPDVGAGAPSNAQRVVELAQQGKVVRRVIAEVFPQTREVVGTSGSTGVERPRVTVQTLKSGEFVRVSVVDSGNRYLLHFPTGPLSGPEPQPQEPARIEILTPPAPAPR